MSGFEFFMHVLFTIVWPPKGIIYMEEQAIQWLVAFSHAWLNANGAPILIALAIYFVIMFVVFQRMPHARLHGGLLGRVMHFIWSMVVVILFAWIFLIYGALRGERNGNRGEQDATVDYTYNNHVTRGFGIVYRFTRLSLHFRLGRAIYRFFYWLTGLVPVISRNNRVHEADFKNFSSGSDTVGRMAYPV